MIKNKPIITDILYEDGLKFNCPYCSSNNIRTSDHSMTTVGNISGPDSNHHWHIGKCNDCDEEFGIEHKLKNRNETHIWYTQKTDVNIKPLVIQGVAVC